MMAFLDIQKKITYKVKTKFGVQIRSKAIYTQRSHLLAKYHYIFNKHREFEIVKSNSLSALATRLTDDATYFSPFGFDLGPMEKWKNIVKSI